MFNPLISLRENLSIEQMNNNLIEAITKTATEFNLKKRATGKINKPWFNKECLLKKKICLQSFNNCKKEKFQNLELNEIYHKEKKEYKREIYKQKKLYYETLIDKLAGVQKTLENLEII